ncbi:MAG: hypothetical protein ACKOW9_00230 [Candidatus Paceibacterota bacterium]
MNFDQPQNSIENNEKPDAVIFFLNEKENIKLLEEGHCKAFTLRLQVFLYCEKGFRPLPKELSCFSIIFSEPLPLKDQTLKDLKNVFGVK